MKLYKELILLFGVFSLFSGCSRSGMDNTISSQPPQEQTESHSISAETTIPSFHQTWQESITFGSESLEDFSATIDDIHYYGGYIGIFSDSEGYIVLTAGPAMNMQPIRIYLTDDSGETWNEIGNPCHIHSSVLTGAAFSSPEIGFICYRYYLDAGPDIWWTSDGGKNWSQLTVTLPDEYKNAEGRLKEEYRFTPKSPEFTNGNGIFPITVLNVDTETETIINMYSSDNGMSWHF